MKFQERLRELGFASCSEYLQSEHWKRFKRRFFASGRSTRCVVCCQKKRIEIHHCTYFRLGVELFDDVVPLCDDHHEAVHKWLTDNNKPVESTQEAIVALRAAIPQVKKTKQQRRPRFKNHASRQQRSHSSVGRHYSVLVRRRAREAVAKYAFKSYDEAMKYIRKLVKNNNLATMTQGAYNAVIDEIDRIERIADDNLAKSRIR